MVKSASTLVGIVLMLGILSNPLAVHAQQRWQTSSIGPDGAAVAYLMSSDRHDIFCITRKKSVYRFRQTEREWSYMADMSITGYGILADMLDSTTLIYSNDNNLRSVETGGSPKIICSFSSMILSLSTTTKPGRRIHVLSVDSSFVLDESGKVYYASRLESMPDMIVGVGDSTSYIVMDGVLYNRVGNALIERSLIGYPKQMRVVDERLYYLTEEGLFVSEDNGASSSCILPDAYSPRDFTIRDSIVLVNYRRFTLMSKDWGRTFSDISWPLCPMNLFTGPCMTSKSDIVMMSLNGMYARTLESDTWTQCVKGLRENDILFAAVDNGEVFVHSTLSTPSVSGLNRGDVSFIEDEAITCRSSSFLQTHGRLYSSASSLYRSDDNGRFWRPATPAAWPVLQILCAANDSVVMYMFENGSFLTSMNLDDGYSETLYSSTNLIKECKVEDSVIAIVDHRGKSVFSTDIGRTWNTLSPADEVDSIWSVCVVGGIIHATGTKEGRPLLVRCDPRSAQIDTTAIPFHPRGIQADSDGNVYLVTQDACIVRMRPQSPSLDTVYVGHPAAISSMTICGKDSLVIGTDRGLVLAIKPDVVSVHHPFVLENITLDVYPNPAVNSLLVHGRASKATNEILDIRLFDSGGRLLRETKLAMQGRAEAYGAVDLASLPSGSYTLSIATTTAPVSSRNIVIVR